MSELPTNSYKHVQVLTSQTKSGKIVVLIGTHNMDDKKFGLGDLLLRHRLQINNDGDEVVWTSVAYLNSKGEMSMERLPSGVQE